MGQAPWQDGLFSGGDGGLLIRQLVAVVVIVVWTGFWSCALMLLIQATVGTNVPRRVDAIGLDMEYHGESGYDSVRQEPEWEVQERKHFMTAQALDAAAKGGSDGIEVDHPHGRGEVVGTGTQAASLARAPARIGRLRRQDGAPRGGRRIQYSSARVPVGR